MIGLKRTLAGALVATLLLTVGACSGLPGANADDPAGVVSAAISAAESSGMAKLADYSCAAKKDEVATALGNVADVGNLGSSGVDVNDLFSSMRVDFQDQTVTVKSRTDSEATVNLKGKVSVAFDEAKVREAIRKVLEAQGLTPDDTMINFAMTTLTSQLSKPRDLDNDLTLIKENGKWVICG